MRRLSLFFRSVLTISVAVAAMLLSLIAALAQGGAPDLEILSKDDARAIFAMTRSEWVENVQRAVTAGAARAMGRPESGGVTMVMTSQAGELFVRPDYSDEGTPDFLIVTVGYRSPTVEPLTDAALNDAIERAKRQMEPEYEVTGRVERLEGSLAIFFTITEKNRSTR